MKGDKTFEEEYQNRNFYTLLDNETVKDFINSYVNSKTKKACLSVLYYMFEEFKETQPDFKINNFFELNPVQARKRIWEVSQNYITQEKYRTALNIKSYGSLVYEYANEEKGLSIKWSKHHKIPSIKVREGETPTHSQVYKLVDCVTHTDTKAVFLLSYCSGLKGEGILNLRIKDYKQAITYRQQIREEITNQLNKTEDSETIKELNYLINNLPLIIKITPQIYYKRFTENGSKSWYPAFICRDSEEMINKYLKEDRPNANDDEPLFVGRLSGNKLTQIQLSKWLKFNIKKFSKLSGKLKDTAPSLLRRSFYNRLISGDMKDIYREFLMGHNLGVKKHYFNWDTQKKEIIQSYIRCNFNRGSEVQHLTSRILSLEEKAKKWDEHKKKLDDAELIERALDLRQGRTKEERERFAEFAQRISDLLVGKTKEELEQEALTEAKQIIAQHEKTEEVIIKLKKDDIDSYMKYRNKGFKKTLENGTYIIMEK